MQKVKKYYITYMHTEDGESITTATTWISNNGIETEEDIEGVRATLAMQHKADDLIICGIYRLNDMLI